MKLITLTDKNKAQTKSLLKAPSPKRTKKPGMSPFVLMPPTFLKTDKSGNTKLQEFTPGQTTNIYESSPRNKAKEYVPTLTGSYGLTSFNRA